MFRQASLPATDTKTITAHIMERFWVACLSHFEQELTTQQFNTWIKPLRLEGGTKGLRLLAPNRFVMQWVKEKFLPKIHAMADEYFSEPMNLDLSLAHPSTEDTPPVVIASRPSSPTAISSRGDNSRLDPSFTFDNFVAGNANRLARAAALQVAENGGDAYNPLFVYGGVGLGKTHLVQAVGNLARARHRNAKISYIHAERYISDVVRAYQHKAFDEFKRYYHSLDLLLIDDIQFIGGKTRTQEEFFYAFNALTNAHKQVIITCDTYPKEILGIADRLISRFGWGLTVFVEPPELEMRVAILIRKAYAENIRLDENVAFFIAKQVRSNVRELEGAMKRVIAYSRFNICPITLDVAKEALKDLLAVQHRMVSITNIQKTVADYYKIKVADMYSKKRTRTLARPRQIAMAIAKELTHLSLPDIGDAFGGRDHTTVLHACRKIAELRAAESQIEKDFTTLLQILSR